MGLELVHPEGDPIGSMWNLGSCQLAIFFTRRVELSDNEPDSFGSNFYRDPNYKLRQERRSRRLFVASVARRTPSQLDRIASASYVFFIGLREPGWKKRRATSSCSSSCRPGSPRPRAIPGRLAQFAADNRVLIEVGRRSPTSGEVDLRTQCPTLFLRMVTVDRLGSKLVGCCARARNKNPKREEDDEHNSERTWTGREERVGNEEEEEEEEEDEEEEEEEEERGDDAGKDEQDREDEDNDDDEDDEEEEEEEKQEVKDEQRKGWKTERGRVVRLVEAAGFYLYHVTVDQRSCET
ncbi:hypothetical protein K0M31_011456, partial [Melipona bicolor]